MRFYEKLTSYPRPYYVAGAFVWALVILVILLLPSNSVPHLRIPHSDKVVHAGMFFLLAWLIWLALQGANESARTRIAILTFLLTAGYGALTEIIQLSAATRTADIFDALADAIGAIILVGLMVRSGKLRGTTRGES